MIGLVDHPSRNGIGSSGDRLPHGLPGTLGGVDVEGRQIHTVHTDRDRPDRLGVISIASNAHRRTSEQVRSVCRVEDRDYALVTTLSNRYWCDDAVTSLIASAHVRHLLDVATDAACDLCADHLSAIAVVDAYNCGGRAWLAQPIKVEREVSGGNRIDGARQDAPTNIAGGCGNDRSLGINHSFPE